MAGIELTFNSILYLFYRLAPFILVSFFVLGSIIGGEVKGFVYLVGLITACCMCFMGMGWIGENANDHRAAVCDSLIINGITSDQTPISMAIFAFSFFYLVYPVAKYHIEIDNVPMLVFFPILILADAYWNTQYECFPVLNIFLTLIIAGGFGVGWAALMDLTKLKGLQYYSVGTNREVCKRAGKQKFRCSTFKNGKKVEFVTSADNTHAHAVGEFTSNTDTTNADGDVRHSHTFKDEDHDHKKS